MVVHGIVPSRTTAIAALATSRSYGQQFGGVRRQPEGQTYQPQQQQYSAPAPQPSRSDNRSSFGNASRSSVPSTPMNSSQPSYGSTHSDLPINNSRFGGHR